MEERKRGRKSEALVLEMNGLTVGDKCKKECKVVEEESRWTESDLHIGKNSQLR